MQWKKVENELPPVDSIVITYGYGGANTEFCQARFDGKDWQEMDSCGDYFDYPPTHWMPLPEPPKE